jgi:hypothetical protein
MSRTPCCATTSVAVPGFRLSLNKLRADENVAVKDAPHPSGGSTSLCARLMSRSISSSVRPARITRARDAATRDQLVRLNGDRHAVLWIEAAVRQLGGNLLNRRFGRFRKRPSPASVAPSGASDVHQARQVRFPGHITKWLLTCKIRRHDQLRQYFYEVASEWKI